MNINIIRGIDRSYDRENASKREYDLDRIVIDYITLCNDVYLCDWKT